MTMTHATDGKMPNSLAERLRRLAAFNEKIGIDGQLEREAADEIERLNWQHTPTPRGRAIGEDVRKSLKRCRDWINRDLNLYFDKEGDRLESTADSDLTEQTEIVNEADAVLAALPANEWRAVEAKVDALRRAQADLVMPQIGPLLDAWDGASNDLRGQIRDEIPSLGLNLDNISAAMEHAEPLPPPPAQNEGEG